MSDDERTEGAIDQQLAFGQRACEKYLDSLTAEGTEIAHERLLDMIRIHSSFSEDEWIIDLHDGWQLQIFTGRQPTDGQILNFWEDQGGDSEEFQNGFSRGLLRLL
jgi:hypothetical protein